MMRNFFPGLLLLVSMGMFVISACLLLRVIPYLYVYISTFDGAFWDNGEALMWAIYPLLLGMMFSIWVANWAWKEIRRERAGRLEQ